MSRNIRIKLVRTPVKAIKRRDSESSSSLDLSSDQGYSGVDEVSDSEDDDEDGVDAAEEEHIIHHEAHSRHHLHGSPQLEQDDDEDADEEDDGDDGEDSGFDLDDEEEEEEEQHEQEVNQFGEVWEGIMSEVDGSVTPDEHTPGPVLPTKRQVRFAGIPDSDSDSTTSEASEDDFFPDIFVEQASLDPTLRREIERDMDDSSSNDSFWDFQDTCNSFGGALSDPLLMDLSEEDEDSVATPRASQAPTEASTPAQSIDEPQGLDGYETDGDTTEEDIPEPIPRKKQARRVQTTNDSSDSETERPKVTPRLKRSGKPRSARFDLSAPSSKPIAFMHPKTGKMIIFTPEKSRDFDLAPECFRGLSFPMSSTTQSSPILSHSGSLMMGAMFSSNTFGDFMNSQHFGPVEAFFPNFSDGNFEEDSDCSGSSMPDEGEKELKLEDFLEFDGEPSDLDRGEPEADTPDWDDDVMDLASTPSRSRRPSAATTVSDSQMEMPALLSHFDNNTGVVGAFRKNQATQKLISSEKASSESLAFSGPYSVGTLRGIKDGSLETVATPITPARKHRRPSVNDWNRSPLETVTSKRKASNPIAEGNHKRHRSISDVRHLEL